MYGLPMALYMYMCLNLKSINPTFHKHCSLTCLYFLLSSFFPTLSFSIGHIMFDDAFEPHGDNDSVGFTVNNFVKQLVQAVATAGR